MALVNAANASPSDAVAGVFYGIELPPDADASPDIETLLNAYAVECAGEIQAIDEALAQSPVRSAAVPGRARLVPRIERDGDVRFCGFWLATTRGRVPGVEQIAEPWRDGHLAATLADAESAHTSWQRFVQWARRVSPGAIVRSPDTWVIDTARRRVE